MCIRDWCKHLETVRVVPASLVDRVEDGYAHQLSRTKELSEKADKEQHRNPPLVDAQVLPAGRSPMHVLEAAKMGADVCTLPPDVLLALFNHPLTDKVLEALLADWQNTGQSIL